jgi:hypothetical protein
VQEVRETEDEFRTLEHRKVLDMVNPNVSVNPTGDHRVRWCPYQAGEYDEELGDEEGHPARTLAVTHNSLVEILQMDLITGTSFLVLSAPGEISPFLSCFVV